MELRPEFSNPTALVDHVADEIGLNRSERWRLNMFVQRSVMCPQDSTLAGRRGLLAQRLPLDKIAEVFA